MIREEKLYDLDDITVIPAVQSKIRHRGEVNPYYYIDGRECLPIFVSPMDCVISNDNFDIYKKNGVVPILPRTEKLSERIARTNKCEWAAYGLSEFVQLFCTEGKYFATDETHKRCEYGRTIYALIDNANGHMDELPKRITEAKELARKHSYCLEVMAGNVANPHTYVQLANAGADYVRCAIGTGNCCITASNTATYMPMASLLDGCRKAKEENKLKCAIVADGGISSYSRAIKALALGADYVMIGSTFGKCFESASPFTKADFSPRDVIEGFGLDDLNAMRFNNDISEETKKSYIGMYQPIKSVWGMSTRRAQIAIATAQGIKKEDIKLKTSEGVEKQVNVEYTLHQWLENFRDYLRSSMSYCNSEDLEHYIGQQEIMLMSEAAKNAINK